MQCYDYTTEDRIKSNIVTYFARKDNIYPRMFYIGYDESAIMKLLL